MRVLKLALLSLLLNISAGAALASQPAASTGPASESSTVDQELPSLAEDMQPQAGTQRLQEEALSKINQALSRGSISAEQATNLKNQLNQISARESWYLSLVKPIPGATVEEDKAQIKALESTVSRQLPLKPTHDAPDALHHEVHLLISTALASKKITNVQAQDYYSNLAQMEADMESLDSDPNRSRVELADLNGILRQLKAKLKVSVNGAQTQAK